MKTSIATRCLFLAGALACAGAQAQALNALWEGQWLAVAASQGQPGAPVRIAREGKGTRMENGGKTCALAYEETVTPAQLLERLQALRSWQLDPEHWPGTDTSQLVGLAQEFDRARAIVQAMAAGSYRRARIRGPGCEGPDDVFLVLHRNGQELVRLEFPDASLGVAITAYHRQR